MLSRQKCQFLAPLQYLRPFAHPEMCTDISCMGSCVNESRDQYAVKSVLPTSPQDLVTLHGKLWNGCCVTASRDIAGISTVGLSFPLIYSDIAMASVKRCEAKKFLNVAACVNSENHYQCLKGYPSNLLGTMCERGLEVLSQRQLDLR